MTSAAIPTLAPRRELWLLLTLAGIQFTHIVDFMIMMPMGPQFRALFGISDAQFGLLVSAYTLAAGASGLLASTFVDRFGRKRLLLVLYALFALATLACGLAPSYGFLMCARIAAGLFGGVLAALSQAIVGDVIAFERRGRAMGIVMTSFSVATVAGVPLGLFLATAFTWHAPFFAIAGVSALFAAFAGLTLPVLRGHLHQKRGSWFGDIRTVVSDSNHLKAFTLCGLLMFSGFTVFPYLTLYMRANVGLTEAQVPIVYLCGGAATLFTARWIGRMTDRQGKVRVFRWLAGVAVLPMLAVTSLGPTPLGMVLVVTTLLFICTSGRMIPGMAILTSAAAPPLRGTFLTLNGAVQSAAMGSAAFVGGHLVSRDAQGLMSGFWLCAALGAVASLCAIWLSGRLHLHGATSAAR